MPANRRIAWLLGLYLLVLLLTIAGAPLVETTEARYGEIAREMIVSGNYLEPHFNGIKHFHKPPLAYWLVAAGMKMFGLNNFGARFFGVIAAALAVFFLYRLAEAVLGSRRGAFAAALIFASSMLFVVVARIASTEIYLTCFTLAAQYFLFRRIWGSGGLWSTGGYALALGLGFLVKGPIILLFTLLPFLVAKLVDPPHRRVFSVREILFGVLLWVVVTLPWYLAVNAANPGLLAYLFKVQTVNRVATDDFHRSQPAWYFLYIFSATFLPYVFFLLRGAARPRDLSSRLQALWLYLVVPFIIFSVVKGKHATYILPLFGVASILTAEAMARLPMPRLRRLAMVLLGVVALAPAVIGFVYPPAAPWRWWLVLAALPSLGLFWLLAKDYLGDRFIPLTAAILLYFFTVGHGLMAFVGPDVRGYQTMAATLNRIDPDRKVDLLVYDAFLPSLSFYRNKLAVMALSEGADPRFETDEEYRKSNISSEEQLQSFLAQKKELFVVARPVKMEKFSSLYPFSCVEVFQQRKYSAYHCR